MAGISQIVSELTARWKDDPDTGIAIAEAKLTELQEVISNPQLKTSKIEGNEFEWYRGRTNEDAFSIWSKVKKNLEDCKAGIAIGGRGFFSPTFNNISV